MKRHRHRLRSSIATCLAGWAAEAAEREAAEAEVAARLTRLSSTGCEHPNPRCKLRSGS